MLSPGASPIVPPGFKTGDRVYTLRTLEDMHAIRNMVVSEGVENIAIVGAGFIGLEMAEQLTKAKKNVTLVEGGGHVLSVMDQDMVVGLQQELVANGVDLLLSQTVKSIDNSSKEQYEFLFLHFQ